jgi:hypothetical protein
MNKNYVIFQKFQMYAYKIKFTDQGTEVIKNEKKKLGERENLDRISDSATKFKD